MDYRVRIRWLGALAAGVALTVAVAAGADRAEASCLTPLGDITGDGLVDVIDVQCAVLQVLSAVSGAAGPGCVNPALPLAADLNCDGQVSVSDVVLAMSYSIKIPLSTALDANQDGCPDTCGPQKLRVGQVYTAGTSSNASFHLRPTGASLPAVGESTGGGFVLRSGTP